MIGFVVAHGRSGTTWTAHALKTCAGLDARHESMRHTLEDEYKEEWKDGVRLSRVRVVKDFGGVEVNGNLYNQVPLIHKMYPDAPVVHLVRDGRKVVRSAFSNSHNPHRTLEQSCTTWGRRNVRMLADVPDDHRFRLEDLLSDFSEFKRLTEIFGAKKVSRARWEEVRKTLKNKTRAQKLPVFKSWPREDQRLFWKICGETMEKLGYKK